MNNIDALPDDIFVPDFEAEQEDVVVNGGGLTRFVKATLFSIPVRPFAKGHSFTLPGVADFDDKSALRQFKGMQKVQQSKTVFYALVGVSKSQTGEVIQVVRAFKGWRQDDLNAWLDLQYPHIKEMDTEQAKALGLTGGRALVANNLDAKGAFVYLKYQEANTGLEGEYDPKQIWTNLVVYNTKAEWETAREAHFAQFGGDNEDVALADFSYGHLTEYIEFNDESFISTLKALASDPANAVEKMKLIPGAELAQVVSDALAIPLPMVDSVFSGE